MSSQTATVNTGRTKRHVGYRTTWRKQRSSEILLCRVRQVLKEFEEQLPLTARQLYYRLIGFKEYGKGQAFEEKLSDLLINARRHGDIPFESIRDDGIMGEGTIWDPDL